MQRHWRYESIGAACMDQVRLHRTCTECLRYLAIRAIFENRKWLIRRDLRDGFEPPKPKVSGSNPLGDIITAKRRTSFAFSRSAQNSERNCAYDLKTPRPLQRAGSVERPFGQPWKCPFSQQMRLQIISRAREPHVATIRTMTAAYCHGRTSAELETLAFNTALLLSPKHTRDALISAIIASRI